MVGSHVPVLLHEAVSGLRVESGGHYVDATVGGGGHAREILATSGPDGRLLGLDRDPGALQMAGEELAEFGDRVILVHASFAQLGDVAAAHGFSSADGVLFDLGLSSNQLADAERGFSFTSEGPLDMRFDPTSASPTAADLINELSAESLAGLFFEFGEEKQSRRIAAAVVEARPIHGTRDLVEVIEETVGRRRGRLHPATLVFQALRIAVNQELSALQAALPHAVGLLRPRGRLAVIAFHSLEDRIVKRFIRRESKDCVCPRELPVCTCDHTATLRVITRKPMYPTKEEMAKNPRSRSARLRVAERKG